MAYIDLNNADVRDTLNEIICFFVSCLNNLVSNLSYEYKNADLALLYSKLKKSITCFNVATRNEISTGNSLFMLANLLSFFLLFLFLCIYLIR